MDSMVPDMSTALVGEMFDFCFCPDSGDAVEDNIENILKDDPEFAQWLKERDEAALAFQMSCVKFDTDHPYEYEE